MLFVSPYKLSSFFRYLNFYLDFFGHIGKRLNKKAQVNFKVHDVIYYWETTNYNAHVAQYLKKSRRLDNEIWSVNKI